MAEIAEIDVRVALVADAENLTIRLRLTPGARLPEKATPGSAGYDVRAFTGQDTEIILAPFDRFAVPTGLFFEIPKGYVVSVRPRSGLALKSGIILPNSPGTIDSDYRGELKIIMANISSDTFTIQSGDRIAQILVEKTITVDFEKVADLSSTDRSAGGFGSTGLT